MWKTINHRRAGLLVVLFLGLCCVYMSSYSARIESTDNLFLFDATGSALRFGDTRLDVSAGVRPPPAGSATDDAFYPLPDVDAEPGHILLAAPLYWLADTVPGFGLVHTVYLLNILVSAAAGVLIYLYALTLDYDARVGVIGAVLFGLGTIIWPYSKTFFREPLVLLFVLTMALCLEKWRRSRYRRLGWLLLALLAGAAALLSKITAIVALPALLIVIAPALTTALRGVALARRVALLLLIGVGTAALVYVVSGPLGFRSYLALLPSTLSNRFVPVALHSYLLSIGGSVWGTSPVILLALPGSWLLARRGHYRYALVALLVLLSFALSFAFGRGSIWFGGLSWPPRFLIPVVPFGIIAAFPVLQRLSRRPLPKVWLLLVAGLFAYGLWIQLSAVSLDWNAYTAALPAEAQGYGEWGGGLNLVAYLRWVVIPRLWSTMPLDTAWVRLNVPGFMLLFGGLALLAGYFALRLLRAQVVRRGWIAALGLTFVLATVLGLRAIYADPDYWGDSPALQQMLPIIEAETEPGDVLLLSDLSYWSFFANYGRLDYPRVVGLPFQPGEQPSPEQAPQVVSDYPDALLDPTSGPLIFALAAQRERLWLLSSSGPFTPWTVRPVERFMATHFYPLREIVTSPRVRLIEYSTVTAPDLFAFRGPQISTDLVYGDALRLLGYDLPQGVDYAVGDVLPISLYWMTDAPLEADYTVAWFLRRPDGAEAVQGWDVGPVAGFAPTSAWRPGAPLWDNRALRIPAGLEAGDYRLWLVVYWTNLDGNVHNLPVSGTETREDFIGVLPTVIQVASP